MTDTQKLLLGLILSLHVSSVGAENLGPTNAYSSASDVSDIIQNNDIEGQFISEISAESAGKKMEIKRNEIIEVIYNIGQLKIKISARSLTSGNMGDEIKFMNLSSRSTLYGVIKENGVVVTQSGGIGP